jgi:hypothetical protein
MNNHTKELALTMVLGDLVAEASPDAPPVLTFESIMAKAEELCLVEVISGDAHEPRKSVGHQLKKLEGKHLMDAKARGYVLGRVKVVAHGCDCPIRFLPLPHECMSPGNGRLAESGKAGPQ